MNAATRTSTPVVKRVELSDRAGLDMPCREEIRSEGQPDAVVRQVVEAGGGVFHIVEPTRETDVLYHSGEPA